MNNVTFAAVMVSVCFGALSTASAQVLVDHQAVAGAGRFDLTPVLSLSEIEYDSDLGDAEVERTIFGLTGGYGLSNDLDLYGEIGFIAESEVEAADDDGNGVMFGGGARGTFFRQDKFSLKGFGGLRFISEDYGDNFEGEFFEVQLGLLGRVQPIANLGLYGGLDLVPFSDGEVEGDNGRDFDADRDDLVGLRFGIDYLIRKVTVNAEFSAVSEDAFIIRATFAL